MTYGNEPRLSCSYSLSAGGSQIAGPNQPKSRALVALMLLGYEGFYRLFYFNVNY